MSSEAVLGIEILPNQRLVDDHYELCSGSGNERSAINPIEWSGQFQKDMVFAPQIGAVVCNKYSIRTSTGIVETTRLLANNASSFRFLAFSLRPEIVWDYNLVGRIAAEVDYFERSGREWVILAAHGRGRWEEEAVSAHFNLEPDLTPARERRKILLASGLLYVANLKHVQKHLSSILAAGMEVEDCINAVIALGYLNGIPSYFSPHLFPCLMGRRSLSLPSVSASTERINSLIGYQDSAPHPFGERCTALKRLYAAFDDVAESHRMRPTFSFVIRTIFTRPQLLNRCLISIDYIRRSLDIPVQIVIASDVDNKQTIRNIEELQEYFPGFAFSFADGRGEKGVSRTRNLKAGIKASNGDRVCIIDDDDYYLPFACSSIARVLDPEFAGILLLDAQIVNEKWTKTEHKYQKEIVSYGTVYKASDWRMAYKGTNSLPLCSVVHLGKYLRSIIAEYDFNYDLSEDYLFHLLIFSHPTRPSIHITEGISVHQSHRASSDNVSTHDNRSIWCLDTGNGIYDLLFKQGRQFEDLAEVGDGQQLPSEPAKIRARCSTPNEAVAEARRQFVSIASTAPSVFVNRSRIVGIQSIAGYLRRCFGRFRRQFASP
jgi:hypothetical protein